MTSLVFLLYAIAHLALFGWSLLLFLRYRKPATVPLLIVTFALIYDNAILAVGGQIGHSELLQNLSVPRFFMHAFGTPLLMLTALGLMRLGCGKWALNSVLAAAIFVLTLAMIAVGVDAELIHLHLDPNQTAGLVSYGNAASRGPPVAPTVTILVLIVAGVMLWRHRVGPWLLVGAMVQFAAAAVGGAILIAGNLGELALLASLILTDSRLSRDSR